MLDVIIEWLNGLRAGEFVLIIIAVGWTATKIYTAVSKIGKQARSSVENDIHKREEYQNVLNDIKTLKTEVDSLRKASSEIAEKVRSSVGESEEADRKLRRALSAAEQMASDHTVKLDEIVHTIDEMQGKINLLFASDKDFCRSYIVEGYNRYVIDEHSINLITLQNMESMYNRYQVEHGDDEFLSKIMTEMRDLPTTK